MNDWSVTGMIRIPRGTPARVCVALVALTLGLAVYLLDRPAGSAYLLPFAGYFAGSPRLWFGALGGRLPDFAHVFAFALLTAVVLRLDRERAVWACIAWWVIDSLFEIGQFPALAPHVAAAMPAWVQGIPVLENAPSYFLRGTFDAWDMVAITGGALAAYGVIALTGSGERERRHSRMEKTCRALGQGPAFWAVAVAGVFAIMGSGGGGSGETDGGGGGSYVWVYIEDPAADTTVDTSVVDLSGSASCPDCPPSVTAFGYCPPINTYPSGGAISVSWVNSTTGASEVALSGITGSYSWLFSYCTVSYHRAWLASVPVAMGINAIEVTATDASGSSGSDSRMITRVLPAPTGVSAAAAHAQITVTWDDIPGATSYNLYWSTSRTFTQNTGTKIAGVTSPYTHTELSDNVAYYYIVTAVNGAYESAASSVAWATTGWSVQVVAETMATAGQRDTSIAVASTGSPHIHFSYGDFLATSSLYNYYTTNAAGAWDSVLVVHPPASANANIALESNGTVHVSYLGVGVAHAVYAAGAWTVEVADSQGWCDASFVLDSAGKAHVVYYQHGFTSGPLRYATNASGTWVSSLVDTFADVGCSFVGRRVSVAVDAAGVAHVAYAGHYPDSTLKYATNPGGSWTASVIDQGDIQQLSAVVDANGKVHIVYGDNSYRLRYAHNQTGAWSISVIESERSLYPSLALDVAGKAHVSYFHNAYGELRYANNTSGAWQVGVIADSGSAGTGASTDTAIAMDSQGKVHIGYFDNHRGSLVYATNR